MSRHPMSEAERRAKAAARKRRQRERQQAALASGDAAQITVTLAPVERERLDELCRVRAVIGQPYSVDEFVSTLIARDWERWQAQQAELAARGPCPKCGDPLPGGCGGLFKGDAACYLTAQSRELLL